MFKSMTGFARIERETPWGSLVWELRSVNHRYLEISLRMAEEFRAMENGLREAAREKLARGKVEASLRFSPTLGAESKLTLNEPLARALLDTCMEVEDWITNAARLGAMDILRWPGVLQEPEPENEALQAAARESFSEALDALVTARGAEGQRLQDLISQRSAAVADLAKQARARREMVNAGLREKLQARIAELGVSELDPGRLEQEVALLAQKLDVDEELDRLDGHLQQLNEIFERDDAVGRRLDFLMQEFNREVNTLGSKSQDAETTRLVVELKVLIEQMREQIQNVE
ncbi:MAG: YicC family protein [Gammaproteobacteria bacterium]